MSTIIYRDDVRVLHTEPVTYQEVRILQGRSPSDVSKLETIAVKSGLFKHRDLDATLVVHATERKHDDRYHFYWYFTIPTLVAILLTIMICNGYPILSNILLSRLVPYAKEIIGDHQCGFRRNSSTIDHIFFIRQMFQKKWEYNEVHRLFIDFKNAYDSARREVVYKILIEFGTPRKLEG